MTRRWVIGVTGEDGHESYWGSWRDSKTAEHLADRLREGVDDPGGELRIRVQWVERWPGLKRALEELGG
jgi:hypothetical protein